jgi:serine O-acetyltransferase
MLTAVQFQKVARWLYIHKIPVLPRLIDYFNRLVFSCWFPHTVQAGKGLVLGYGGLANVIHSDAILGDNVHIDQGVTIGGNGRVMGVPVIDSKVYIGAGAKILGPIHIGEGCVIGANAVFITDIPARSVAVGIPARVIHKEIDIATYLRLGAPPTTGAASPEHD